MSDSYIGMWLSLPNVTTHSLISMFFLGLMRIAPIVSVAPFLGGKLPGGVKVGLAISLTFLMLPSIIFTTKNVLSFDVNYMAYAIKELFIGFTLAVLCTVPFYIANMAGSLIDFLRGSQALMVQDPLVQTQVSSIGLLYNYVLVVLFFEINGPQIFLDGVFDSYKIIPADGFFSAAFFASTDPFWEIIMGVINKTLVVAIQLSAPSLLAVLMTEVFLGIANRLAPQVQIAFLGMSLKSLVGLALLYAAWFYILVQMGKQSHDWLLLINKVIYYFGS